MDIPKLFISYSWSNIEHQEWVLELATGLRESGIDVILDKWDLKEGQDTYLFMEKMVNDTEIKKVAIICDQKYADKANNRSGGVGTETQIISREVYEKQDQNKFVAVIREKDQHGEAFLPTYYKSRIYIDLTGDRYSENYEQLLRWVFDKPLYKKPEIGERPSFLSDDENISLGTTAYFNRCIEAIRNHKPYAIGAFEEYCGIFTANLERFRLTNPSQEEGFKNSIIKNIEDFLPYRNEVIELLVMIAKYSPTEEFAELIHRFLEGLIPFMDRTKKITSWGKFDFDNYRFLIYELFLYALAVLLKYERLDLANYLLTKQYYLRDTTQSKDLMNFTVFYNSIESFQIRGAFLRQLSIRADLLFERSASTGIDFLYLQQADFIAFMRSEVETEDKYARWSPDTLIYLEEQHRRFEIFAKSVSKVYFDNAKSLLGINKPDDLEPLFQSYRDEKRRTPSWGHFNGIDILALLGYKELSSKP
jgi:TIR domain